jgi:hypothetical protein
MSMLEEKLFYDLTLPTSLTGSAIRFTQCTDPNPKFGATPIAEVLTGSPYVEWTGVGSAEPDFTFSTKDLTTLFTMLVAARTADNAKGFMIADFTGNGDVGYQAMKGGSSREDPLSLLHDVHRFMNPVLYLQGLSANQDGDAAARVRMCPKWDGSTTDPKVLLTLQALNASRPSAVSMYTLGPVKLNGSWITGEQSTDLTFDLGWKAQRASGRPYPTLQYAKTLITRLGISTKTAAYLSSLITPITALSVYFIQRKENASPGFWPDADSKHIKITATGGCSIADSLTGGEATAPLSLIIKGAVTISVNSAIT